MGATREGERVDVYSTGQATRYGQLIQAVDENGYSKFIRVDNGGNLSVTSINTLVPEKFDEIALTYVTSGNGVGEIETVTYKLNSVDVATLTLSYDSSNRLIGVSR